MQYNTFTRRDVNHQACLHCEDRDDREVARIPNVNR
jgi:hypothetical protein